MMQVGVKCADVRYENDVKRTRWIVDEHRSVVFSHCGPRECITEKSRVPTDLLREQRMTMMILTG